MASTPFAGTAAERDGGTAAQRDGGSGAAPFTPHRTLELPMRLLGRTVKRTADALEALQPGQVLAVVTDDP